MEIKRADFFCVRLKPLRPSTKHSAINQCEWHLRQGGWSVLPKDTVHLPVTGWPALPLRHGWIYWCAVLERQHMQIQKCSKKLLSCYALFVFTLRKKSISEGHHHELGQWVRWTKLWQNASFDPRIQYKFKKSCSSHIICIRLPYILCIDHLRVLTILA